ncbi:hypothetical protein CK203_003688 [Vitis vinifera]|uniref:Uncharacterized protein n=1 Tax=Vitis vinifera TaxID=29760 RepID=A0A438K896_VITVI|nr:hypothetical protein CK203_003688 [Vitis vinifera]
MLIHSTYLTSKRTKHRNKGAAHTILVGTPPSENTWHASYNDTWHALSSESPSSGSPYKAHMAHFSGLPQGRPNDTYKHIIRTAYTIHPDDQEDQTTLINVSSGWLTQYIRIINICHPDTMLRIID